MVYYSCGYLITLNFKSLKYAHENLCCRFFVSHQNHELQAGWLYFAIWHHRSFSVSSLEAFTQQCPYPVLLPRPMFWENHLAQPTRQMVTWFSKVPLIQVKEPCSDSFLPSDHALCIWFTGNGADSLNRQYLQGEVMGIWIWGGVFFCRSTDWEEMY